MTRQPQPDAKAQGTIGAALGTISFTKVNESPSAAPATERPLVAVVRGLEALLSYSLPFLVILFNVRPEHDFFATP